MCKVMGIVNVTPDSFSDGGQFFKPEEAIRRAMNLIADGADIIDLGGESTRPGATPIGWEEEWARIEPVLADLAGARRPRPMDGDGLGERASRPLISVDTYHPETAERAIKAGAHIINCVYAEPISEMLKLLKGNEVELVVPYRENGEAISRSLQNKDKPAFYSSGQETASPILSRLYLDPMIGFNTTREEDIELLRSIPELAKKGRVLIGASRKRIVKKLVGEKSAVGKNIGGNVAIAVGAAMQGASVVRVHDVKETVQALRVIEQLRG